MNILYKASVPVLFSLSVTASAQIFECIDANGKKTFAQECPPSAAKQKELHPEVTNPGAPVTSDGKLKQLSDSMASQRQAQNARDAERDKQAGDARNNAQACSDAKARLDAMQSGKQSRRIDPVTGQHVAMDDTQRQNDINSLNEQIAQNCK